MQNFKILIWDYNIIIKNSGGPAGYLYNLREYLLKNPNKYQNIYFISDLINKQKISNPTKKEKWKFLQKIDFIKQRIEVFRFLKKWSIRYKKINSVNLNDFDIIHFHVCSDLLNASNLLKDYKGKIILTSHSPQPTSCEISEIINCRFSLIRFIVKKYFLFHELKSWNLADYLMFPVKEATEPYKSNNKMKVFLEQNVQKLLYCPSSILDVCISRNKELFCKKLNIPSDSFIISYIGRHNVIKGYDQLKKTAKCILDTNPNVYFVIAGNEYPIKRLKHKRWIELGWINYGNELIANSDLFILPNKETYFDLIALEVLRAGTPILMTKTGGNKHFTLYSNANLSIGIFFYDYSNIEMSKDIISKIIKLKDEGKMDEIRKYNRQLFLEQFTVDSFLERYISCLKHII